VLLREVAMVLKLGGGRVVNESFDPTLPFALHSWGGVKQNIAQLLRREKLRLDKKPQVTR